MNGEMRVLDSPIGKVTPIIDIAEMIGYDRSTINKIMKGYGELLSPFQTFLTLPTSGGNQQHLCVNRAGFDMLLLMIKPAKTRDSFEKFMKAREMALKNLDGNGNGSPAFESEISKARMLAEKTGGDLAAFQAIALRKCGFGEYADALMPALKHGEAGIWLNPTQIGLRCGHSAREVNHFLEWHKFQYQSNGFWRLTEKGEQFGEEYFFESPSKHREIRIRWKENILTASGLVREPSETLALVARV